MLEGLLTIASSSGLGAVIGAVGSWATKRENRKMKEIDNAHEERMAEIETQQMEMEHNHALSLADKQIEQAQVEGEIEKDIAETNAFTESLKSQKILTNIKFVDAIRFLMRPLITVYLLAMMSYLAYNIHMLVNGLDALPISQIAALYTQIISQLMFLTTTAVTWWFGSRGSK